MDLLQTANTALQMAEEAGAQKARVCISESEEDLVATLNGQTDKVTHCADKSLSIAVFADGRFSSFLTNDLSDNALRSFIRKAVGLTKLVAEDPLRDLPDPARYCRDALSGDELSLSDPARKDISPKKRIEMALDAAIFGKEGTKGGSKGRLISEEGEYSDSFIETVLADTNGLCCRHKESSFDYAVEITVEEKGEKYSSYHWDSASHLSALNAPQCGPVALKWARDCIGARTISGGRYTMVADKRIASKLISPLLKALSAYSIQQNNSFLKGSLGNTLFSEKMTLLDRPRIPFQNCSKYFDSEGVATRDGDIIRNGAVSLYFVNTYMSHKLNIAPTIEDATRPVLLPTLPKGSTAEDLMRLCGRGIYVTEFNGGNSDPISGDFSYGVQGFLFENGGVLSPVDGMLITGNFITLWKNFIASADDCRSCMSKLIPTLAFDNVEFSA